MMFCSRSRPDLYRASRIRIQPRRNHFSTQANIRNIKSNSFRAAAIGLAIGLPSGFVARKSWAHSPKNPSENGFFEGSLAWKGKAVKPFTLSDVDSWLREEEALHQGPSRSGVKEWYSVRCAANSPCEDNYVAAQSPVSGSTDQPWLFWGVFDGHNGWAMSTTLRETLVPYVSRHLKSLFQSGELPTPETIDNNIISAFRQLDDEFISDGVAALKDSKSLTEALSRLALGFAGSCAIFSIFDPSSRILRVACTGDCRAVIGSRNSGTYVATPLSEDQTGFNEAEIARIDAEHPGEQKVIDPKTGRVLGIMVSRAFGDGLWKWPLEVILECQKKFFWKAPRPGYKTPPYLTAEPVITTTHIQGGEFMILASDGLWDHLSSEQAVRLVEMWLIARKEGTIGKTTRKPPTVGKVTTKILYGDERMKDEDFTVEDNNVATHLVRNALGGADTEKLCGLVGVQPPLAREVRDDITVQVVFFDK